MEEGKSKEESKEALVSKDEQKSEEKTNNKKILYWGIPIITVLCAGIGVLIWLLLTTNPGTNITNPVQDLITRVAPKLKASIELVYSASDQDFFSIASPNAGKVQITGNSQVSLSFGFNYQLTRFLNQSISWTGDNIANEPVIIPIENSIKKERTFKYTQYFNVCTFSQSMVWWDWARWEREIDFMAVRGINLALAFTGQEQIQLKTMEKFGISEAEVIGEFFTGPAFLAWQRMGNIRGWAGPLRKSWIEDQFNLQKRILQRMKDLGIKAVLPAFSGFVPKVLKEKYPNANISQAAKWNGFQDNQSCDYFIEPTDPLFKNISKTQTDALQEYFGPNDHFYNGDNFNEMDPPSKNPEQLKSVGKVMIDGLLASDKEAIWVMQGWLFYNSKFWENKSLIEAYLSGIDNKNMLILDLYSEVRTIYDKTSSYYGKPFIWNELHDFGGSLGFYGKLPTIMNEPFKAISSKSTVVGVGITMEGISQNMIVQDLMLEIAWMAEPSDLFTWTKSQITSRYGFWDVNVENTWKALLRSVQNCSDERWSVTVSWIEKRPSVNFQNNIYYNQCEIIDAGRNMLKANKSLVNKTSSYLYDIVDIVRQILSDMFTYEYFKNLLPSIKAKNIALMNETRKKMENIIQDMDLIVGTHKDFLFGKWLQSAQAWAKNDEEKKQYRFNAKNQITMWGPNAEINDQASKQWNGLINKYQKERWIRFFDEVQKALFAGIEFDQEKFNKLIFNFELQWNNDQTDEYSIEPFGDIFEISDYILSHWSTEIKLICP